MGSVAAGVEESSLGLGWFVGFRGFLVWPSGYMYVVSLLAL